MTDYAIPSGRTKRSFRFSDLGLPFGEVRSSSPRGGRQTPEPRLTRVYFGNGTAQYLSVTGSDIRYT